MQVVSFVQLFEILWTVACLAPLSMGIPKQECWTGLPFPSAGHLPDLGIKPRCPAWQVDSLPLKLLGSPYHTYTFIWYLK